MSANDLEELAGKVFGVLTLAGFSPQMVGPFDVPPGLHVQLDHNDGPGGVLTVRWQTSQALEEAGAETRDVDTTLRKFDVEIGFRMRQTLTDILTDAGFELSEIEDEYAPTTVHILGFTPTEVIALAGRRS